MGSGLGIARQIPRQRRSTRLSDYDNGSNTNHSIALPINGNAQKGDRWAVTDPSAVNAISAEPGNDLVGCKIGFRVLMFHSLNGISKSHDRCYVEVVESLAMDPGGSHAESRFRCVGGGGRSWCVLGIRGSRRSDNFPFSERCWPSERSCQRSRNDCVQVLPLVVSAKLGSFFARLAMLSIVFVLLLSPLPILLLSPRSAL